MVQVTVTVLPDERALVIETDDPRVLATIPTTIYALVDPRAPESIRYVGKTVAPVSQRVQSHIDEARREQRNHRHRWILSLLRDDTRPLAVVLEIVPPYSDWAERERHWISMARSAGCLLTNATDGGEGAPGHSPSQETRQRMSRAHAGRPGKIGFQHTAESRLRMSEAHRGVAKTVEHKKKISDAHRGKKRPPRSAEWQEKINIGARKPRGPLSAAHKEKLRLAGIAYYVRKKAGI